MTELPLGVQDIADDFFRLHRLFPDRVTCADRVEHVQPKRGRNPLAAAYWQRLYAKTTLS